MGCDHNVHIYLENHSVCPLVGIGPPHPLSRKQVCSLHPEPKGGAGAHSPAGKEVGESQFQRLEKRFSILPTLWLWYLCNGFKKIVLNGTVI